MADEHDVLGVDSFSEYYARNFKEGNLVSLRDAPNFRLIEGDLNDLALTDILRDREWVFHQAAQPGVRSSWGSDFETYLRSNVGATQKLLEASRHARELSRFVFSSSSSVYGNQTSMPINEEAIANPISPYGLTKLMAERLCFLYRASFSIPIVGLRYFTVYGPRQRPDMAFHRFGKALLSSESIIIYGNGHQTRDFTYVSDVVQANIDAATATGVTGVLMNIGGGSRVSLLEAIDMLEEISGLKCEVRLEQTALGDVTDTFADIARARQLLGYRPRATLRQGLEAELAYLRTVYPAASRSAW